MMSLIVIVSYSWWYFQSNFFRIGSITSYSFKSPPFSLWTQKMLYIVTANEQYLRCTIDIKNI